MGKKIEVNPAHIRYLAGMPKIDKELSIEKTTLNPMLILSLAQQYSKLHIIENTYSTLIGDNSTIQSNESTGSMMLQFEYILPPVHPCTQAGD